ncbi:DsbA family protein [Catenuloplanes japonicus]|uniref:DsbA family protein n=1 Tax=Catenuloplanes japonicus TaxID=33876 RepID=UPI0005262B56
MSTNLKITIGMVVAAVVVLATALVIGRAGDGTPVPAAARDDSHRISTAADGRVTVVEFLDFECAACGAAYPGVERLRADYGNSITYVVRYFPIASHPNAYTSAHAAEAAARQGAFEPMYRKLFDNQRAWGGQRQDRTETFIGYARELGLDSEKFRADMADPAVDARVRAEADDGVRLGVQGTPTFFVNGVEYEPDALKQAIDQALSR